MRLDQLTNIDIQDEVKFGLVTSHMKHFLLDKELKLKGQVMNREIQFQETDVDICRWHDGGEN